MNRQRTITERLLERPEYAAIQSDVFAFKDEFLGFDSPIEYIHMLKAMAFVEKIIYEKKNVLIIGDKDADGMISTAMIMRYLLRRDHTQCSFLIPKIDNDYGLVGDLLQKIQNGTFSYLIILDMGVTFLSEIQSLLSNSKTPDLQIQILVIDHHQIDDQLKLQWQQACAISKNILLIHPAFCSYTSVSNTATAGLVFKLLLGIALWSTEEKHPYEFQKQIFHLGKLIVSKERAPVKKKISMMNMDDEMHKIILEANVQNIGKLFLHQSIMIRKKLWHFVREQCELAALAILADMMPLYGDNRKIVRNGLPIYIDADGNLSNPNIQNCFQNEGLKCLMKHLHLKDNRISLKECSWQLIPHVNAAGRLGRGEVAVNLLISDAQQAENHAKTLLELNKQRKKHTTTAEKIIEKIMIHQDHSNKYLIFVYHADLPSGLSGLLANRLAEKYQKIAVLISPNGQYARGSVRNGIPDHHIHLPNFLSTYVGDLLQQLGGHPYACGFSIDYQNIPLLQKEMESLDILQISKNMPEADELQHRPLPITIRLQEMNSFLFHELARFMPFGIMNPEPLFELPAIRINHLVFMGEQEIHMRFPIFEKEMQVVCYYWQRAAQFKQEFQEFLIPKKSKTRNQFYNYQLTVPVDIQGYFETSFFNKKFEYRMRITSIKVQQLPKPK